MLFPTSYLQVSTRERKARPDASDLRFSTRVEDYHGQAIDATCIVILGIPQHIGVERNGGRTGAAEAPACVREHFYKLTISDISDDVAERVSIIDCGDLLCEGLSLEQIHDRQTEVVRALLSTGAFVFVLGGGHDIAYANGMALLGQQKSVSFINVDAHLDVRPFVRIDGVQLRHSGSPFRQLLEEAVGSIPVGSCTEFGIQAFVASSAHVDYVKQKGHCVRSLDELRNGGIEIAYQEALDQAATADSIYCSFDIDAVSGAYAPGVSAVGVDGFSAAEILTLVRQAAGHPKCKLIDIVEFNPRYDQDNRTAKLVAQILARGVFERARLIAQ